jgi:hypothetical protein
MKYCEDCGTKLNGGVCPNCQEELYILENQIYTNDEVFELSEDFVDRAKKQESGVVSAGNRKRKQWF